MGWLFGYRNTTEIKSDLNAMRGNLKVVDQKVTSYGRHIWSLYETATGERFINLDLCEKHEREWGYKDMDETMGPCYYDCPMTLIQQAGPTPHVTAQTWRESVKEFHARRARKLLVGNKIRMWGKDYTVVSAGHKKIIRREDGAMFRLTRRNMDVLEIVG